MTAILELRGVGKTYGTGHAALHVLADVNLTVEQGEYLAVIGPSGSGKSTLLNILGCLDVPSAGHYLVEGRNVNSLDDTQLSHLRNRRIGFVFQSFQLVSHLTVLENVELPLFYARRGRSERRARAVEHLPRPRPPLGRRHAAIDHRQLDVLQGRQPRQQLEGLEDEADAPVAELRQLVVAEGADVVAREAVVAFRGPVEAAQDVHQRRLARA